MVWIESLEKAAGKARKKLCLAVLGHIVQKLVEQ